jgi:hypothetical protein
MGLTPGQARAMFDTNSEPFNKQHLVYTGINITERYVAPISTANGEPCKKQKLSYILIGTENYIENVSWEDATWNSAWDI